MIPAGSEWKFLDTGASAGADWTKLDFKDDSWREGPGQLGYGDGDEKTKLNDSRENYPTYYFRLRFEVKLKDDAGNSGIQFRSRELQHGEVQGYQADAGPGWWGKLYEEHGRGLMWERGGEDVIEKGGWNEYEILALGLGNEFQSPESLHFDEAGMLAAEGVTPNEHGLIPSLEEAERVCARARLEPPRAMASTWFPWRITAYD